MKATELISRLAKLIGEHGDLEVKIHTLEVGYDTNEEVTAIAKSVYYEEAFLQSLSTFKPYFEIYGE